MTRAIGRVAYPSNGEYVEYVEHVAPNELDQIGRSMSAIDREQAGLLRAVRLARARGYTWDRIGAILGVSRQAAWERFKDVDAKLLDEDKTVSDGSLPEPSKQQAPPGPTTTSTSTQKLVPVKVPAPVYDFSALGTLSTDEIIAMAATLPKDVKLFDAYLMALREAIVVTLYKRDVDQRKIAVIINKSRQRVSQLITAYYTRLEQTWAEERASWQKES